MAPLCLTFQAEKHTELYRARQTAFISQLIDLENTSAGMFVAAYQFFLCFVMPVGISCHKARAPDNPTRMTLAGSKLQMCKRRLLFGMLHN